MEIIQLCEAQLLCTQNATAYLRIYFGKKRSRPIPVCDKCRPGVEAKIAAEGCRVSAEPISRPTA